MGPLPGADADADNWTRGTLGAPSRSASATWLNGVCDGARAGANASTLLIFPVGMHLPKVEQMNQTCAYKGRVVSSRELRDLSKEKNAPVVGNEKGDGGTDKGEGGNGREEKENAVPVVEVVEVSELSMKDVGRSLTACAMPRPPNAFDGELLKISAVQKFVKGQPTVFLSLRNLCPVQDAAAGTGADADADGHRAPVTILLRGESTRFRPFLHVGEHYRISYLTWRLCKDRNDSLQAIPMYEAKEACTFKTLKFLWRGGLVSEIPAEDLAHVISQAPDLSAPVLTVVGAQLSSYVSPGPGKAYYLAKLPVTIDCRVNRVLGPCAVGLVGRGGLTLYMKLKRDGGLKLCLRSGARLRCTHVFPVYLWGLLKGFYVCTQSHVSVLSFSTVACPLVVPKTVSSTDKCVLYQAWEMEMRRKLEAACVDTRVWSSALVPATLQAVASAVPQELFALPHSNSQKEFTDDVHVALYCVRAGVDADWLGVHLPELLSPGDLHWTGDELGAYAGRGCKLPSASGMGSDCSCMFSVQDLCRMRRQLQVPAMPLPPMELSPRTIFLAGAMCPIMPFYGRPDVAWLFRLQGTMRSKPNSLGNVVEVRIVDGMTEKQLGLVRGGPTREAMVVIANPWYLVCGDKPVVLTQSSDVTVVLCGSGTGSCPNGSGTNSQGSLVDVNADVGSDSDALVGKGGEGKRKRTDDVAAAAAVVVAGVPAPPTVRELLQMTSDAMVSLRGVVIHIDRTKTKPVVYVRGLAGTEFLACYCDPEMRIVKEVLTVGCIVTLERVHVARGKSGRLYASARKCLKSALHISGHASLADMHVLMTSAHKRPDNLAPPMAPLCADPVSIAMGGPPPTISLAGLQAQLGNGAANVAWTVTGHCVHVNLVEVTHQCSACTYTVKKYEHNTSLNPLFQCINANCQLHGTPRSVADTKMCWETQVKFDDGTGEVILYLHNEDFFRAVTPRHNETFRFRELLTKRDKSSYCYGASLYDTTPHVSHVVGAAAPTSAATAKVIDRLDKLRDYLETAARSVRDGKVCIKVEHQGIRGATGTAERGVVSFPDKAMISAMENDGVIEGHCRIAVSLALGKARHRQVRLSAVVRIKGRGKFSPWGEQESERGGSTRKIAVQQVTESAWYHQTHPLPTRAPPQMKLRALSTQDLSPVDMQVEGYALLRELRE